MEDYSQIAAEVEAALIEASDVSQEAGYPITLRRISDGAVNVPNTGGTTTYYQFIGMDTRKEMKDADGRLIGETKRTLTVNATAGIVPDNGDEIAVGVKASDAEAFSGPWVEIVAVRPLSPFGVPVYFDLDLTK